jgi:uncharacterized protein YyaL (SSP411 family)
MDSAAPYQARFVETDGEHAHTNRLIDATSPYLLQHAHNPVDWYPWGEEAFAAARAADKPIFLSVGYSTCYWCHVMERESFENEDVAAVMNEHFVCIKVDREERPDVDDLYMTAVQMFSNGHGGWPMSVFLEPDSLRPFFAGTYFPPQDAHGRPGFTTLLGRIAEMWGTQRDVLLEQAGRAAGAIADELRAAAEPVAVGQEEVDNARDRLLSTYDSALGGFGSAPKFPQPGQLRFLMESAWDDESARAAVLHTLDAMSLGGMYDQIGGGFHRYSTDAKWLVPHFEKMLYDNGQLAELYARAFEATGDQWYERVLRQTLDYVLREMTDGSGRFYSAQDAEVDASEGASYVWTDEAFTRALETGHLAGETGFARRVYAIDGGPNFRDPHDPSANPVNVLFLPAKPDADQYVRIDAINRALLGVRNRRKQPMTDDKTLTGWNGLMIAGMAEGGRVLEEPRYLDAAARAADFILDELRDPATGLQRTWRAGRPNIPAFLEDYAFFIHGLLRLHAATGEERWLTAARELVDEARQLFANPSGPGWYDSRPGQTDLFVRIRSRYDGATPAANSQMVLDLLGLHDATGEEGYLREAASTLGSLSSRIQQFPTAATVALCGLHRIAQDFPAWLPDGDGLTVDAKRPVTIAVDAPLITLEEGSGRLEVTLQIAEGFHVNAHDPRAEGLVGIEIVGVGETRVDAQYPTGELLEVAFADTAVLVHEGTLAIPVTVRTADPASARLVIRWQACNDRICLAPVEEVLPVVFR